MKKNTVLEFVLLLSLILVLLPGLSYSDSTSVNVSQDTYLNSYSPTTNYDTSQYFIGEYASGARIYRGTFCFTMPAQPTNATLKNVSLQYTCYSSAGYPTSARGLELYRLDYPFTESQATWNVNATGVSWSTPGGDYNTTAIDNISFSTDCDTTETNLTWWVYGGSADNNASITWGDTFCGLHKLDTVKESSAFYVYDYLYNDSHGVSYPLVNIGYDTGTTSTSTSTTSTSTTSTTSVSTTSTITSGSHPMLVFTNFSDTPGYKYQASAPWSTWKSNIEAGTGADDYAMEYLLDGEQANLDLATNYLLTLDTSWTPRNVAETAQLYRSCLAYDFIQANLSTANDSMIRDRMALYASNGYADMTTQGMSYNDLNGQLVPALACIGLVLNDYVNSSLSSTPQHWYNWGTSGYFTSDNHSGPSDYSSQGFFSYGYDSAGNHMSANYESYSYGEEFMWMQILDFQNSGNLSGVYPMAIDWILAHMWTSMPNRIAGNYMAGGAIKWEYPDGLVNILDSSNASYVMGYYDNVTSDTDYPIYTTQTFTKIQSHYGDTQTIVFATYENKTNITRADPPWTAHFDETASFQTDRADWSRNSSWYSFMTWPDGQKHQERGMSHGDQFDVSYYELGNLMVGDCGEIKHRIQGYEGADAFSHNTVVFSKEDGDNIFGIRKGTPAGYEVYNPANVTAYLANDTIDFIESEITGIDDNIVNMSIGSNAGSTDTLANPLTWRRSVLLTDYMLILDELNNSVQREIHQNIPLHSAVHNDTVDYSNTTTQYITPAVQSTTFKITLPALDTPSIGFKSWIQSSSGAGTLSVYVNDNLIGTQSMPKGYGFWFEGFNQSYVIEGVNNITFNTSDSITAQFGVDSYPRQPGTLYKVGLANGTLDVNGTSLDWSTPVFNVESSNTEGNYVDWNTTTAYDDDISLKIFSVPLSNISVTKRWAKTGGIGLDDEIDMPTINLKTNTSGGYYAITAYDAIDVADSHYTYTDVGVTGGLGNAMKITDGTWIDRISHSNGSAVTFDSFSTDARYSWSRNTSDVYSALIRDGTNYSNGSMLIDSDTDLEYLLYEADGVNVTLVGDGTDDTNATFYVASCVEATNLSREGVGLTRDTDWNCTDSTHVWIDMDFSSTDYTSIEWNIYGAGAPLANVTPGANGEACVDDEACTSGNCVDGYCCDTTCTGTCNSCAIAGSLGTCSNVTNQTDPDAECAATGCGTGSCDGLGVCGYYTSGEQNCAACQTCDSATSITCVNVTNDLQDSQGSNLCESECRKCTDGACANQTAEDLFSQCDTIGCGNDTCQSGSCGYYTSGEGECPACQTCNGTESPFCANIDDNNQDTEGSTFCNDTCVTCDGGGNCVSQDSAEDLFSQCPGLACGTNAVDTIYYYGWIDNDCYWRDNVTAANAKCDGSSACITAATYCPDQTYGDSSGVSCDCISAQDSCSGTSIGTCNDTECIPTLNSCSCPSYTILTNSTVNMTLGYTANDNVVEDYYFQKTYLGSSTNYSEDGSNTTGAYYSWTSNEGLYSFNWTCFIIDEFGNVVERSAPELVVVSESETGLPGVTLEAEDLNFQASGGVGVYELDEYDVTLGVVEMTGSTEFKFKSINETVDIISNTTGLLALDVSSHTFGIISADELLWVHNIISSTGNVTVTNFTGLLTNATVCYDSLGGGNITLNIPDVGGECNYMRYNLSGYSDSVFETRFNVSSSNYSECSVLIRLNSSVVSGTCFNIAEDYTLSSSALATLLAMMGVSILLVSRGYYWSTRS